MSKFNVGDKVRVVKIIPNKWDSNTHDDLVGEVGIISATKMPKNHEGGWNYYIDILDLDQFGMLEDELELVGE